MDINAKIKLIADTMSGYTVLVDSSNGANVQLSKIQMPCILIFIQDTGEVLSANSHYRDSVNIRVAFLNKIPKGFKESDVETMRYELKQDMFILFHKLKFDFQFKTNTESLRYEIVYDEFDDNLIGVVFNDNIKERVGLNLSCDVPDSHGELPSSPSFCQKVSECPSIVSINELIEGLQDQIDNLPTTTGVESVYGNQVNNTDPLNPIIESLGLIKIIDKQGDFFTDLASASTWIDQYFSDPTIITNKSFNNNVLFFTVPNFTIVDLADGFLNNSSASFIDELGLISEFNGGSVFINNSSRHIFGNIFFNVAEAFTNSYLDIELLDFDMDANCAFASASTGKAKISGNIGAASASSSFFSNSSATLLVSSKLYTSNAGNIDASVGEAILNGCNVFFDGIDKEDVKNKVLNFNSPNNTDYATTQATINLVDNRVQSNIKIIGDWDATSGSYPLADESNTTPFITQWGATIKAGWAFRVGYGQAGTVDGLDYENGDVVYALVDNPTDNSSDWGDLAHNLQQANESTRGTSKVVTAAIVADETSTDDERFITSKKIWLNFWTRVLAIAHTFAAKITFTSAPRFNSASASQYLKTDSTKDLTSVSAIPATDIMEDSTHRFINDQERTIWNNKQDVITYLKIITGNQNSNTNVLANITGLYFSGLPNTRYRVQGIICHGQTNNDGLVLGFTCPIDASFYIRGYGNGINLNSLIGIYSKSSGVSTPRLNMQVTDLGASIFNGEISFGASGGTFNFQFARNSNLGTATVYQLGTNIEIVKLN